MWFQVSRAWILVSRVSLHWLWNNCEAIKLWCTQSLNLVSLLHSIVSRIMCLDCRLCRQIFHSKVSLVVLGGCTEQQQAYCCWRCWCYFVLMQSCYLHVRMYFEMRQFSCSCLKWPKCTSINHALVHRTAVWWCTWLYGKINELLKIHDHPFEQLSIMLKRTGIELDWRF